MNKIAKTTDVSSSSDEDIDLSRLFRDLWRNKWLLLGAMLIALIIGIIYSSRQVPQYQVEALLQIQAERQGGAGLAGKLSQQFNFGGQNNSEDTQIALLKSRYILGPVIHSLGLDIQISPIQSFINRFFFHPSFKISISQFDVDRTHVNVPFTLVTKSNQQYVLYDLKKKIVLKGEVGQLVCNANHTICINIASIKAKPNSNFQLKKIPDSQIMRSLQNRLQIIDLGTNRQRATGVLSLVLNDSNPQKAVSVLNAISKTIQEKDIQKKAVEASKTLDFLYQQLPLTRRDLARSEHKLNTYRAKSGKIDMKLQAEYLLKQLTEIDKQLSELRINKIDMLQRYTTQHPFIVALNTKIREFKVHRQVLEKQLKTLPASDQISVNLMRDVEVKNSFYMVLLKKIQELQMIKAGIVSDIRILSLAKLPNETLPTKKGVMYLFSMFVGLIIGTLIILGRKIIFPRVVDPYWSEKHCDLVNLSVIPYSKEQILNSGSKGTNLKSLPLLAHINPRNLAVESLRSLRTTLQIRLGGNVNNIISIMGVSPGVGKTFISANLSYLLATAGKRVVVVDTDMRRGTLHKYFNLSASPGLSELLNQQVKLDNILYPTFHENLTVLTRGTYPVDPAELLTSESFGLLIKELSQKFDLIIIDTPPVLLVTDALIIGVHSETNYLVLGADTHRPTEIATSIKRLSNAGIHLQGTIFNFQKKKGGESYGYEYKYYYDDKENQTVS